MKNFGLKLFIPLLFALFFACMAGFMATTSADVKISDGITVTVDTLSYSKKALPNGLKGETYPLFDYTATDASGKSVENTQVLVHSPSGTLVSVKDGRFKTEEVGLYKIEYAAFAGAISEKIILEFNVIDVADYTEMSCAFDEGLTSSVKTGEVVVLPNGETSGGLGDITSVLSVKYVGDYLCDSVAVEDNGLSSRFIPKTEGVYEIVYTLTDFVGKVKTVTVGSVTVTDDVNPVMNTPSLAPAAYVGEKYVLPAVEATVYNKGKIVYVPATVKVGGESYSDYYDVPNDSKDFSVTYSCVNPFDSNGKVEYSFDVKVIDKNADKPDGFMLMDDYLNLDGFTTSFRSRADAEEGKEVNVFLLTADGSKTTATMRFNNAIHENYANVTIGTEPSALNFGSVNLTFTDSVNADEKIAVTLNLQNKANASLSLNGKLIGSLEGKNFGIAETVDFSVTTIKIAIDSENRVLLIDDEVLCSIDEFYNGETFGGFSSGYVYLNLNAENITDKSMLKLKEIASVSVSSDTSDSVEPHVIYSSSFAFVSNVEYGEKVCFEKLEAFDLFNNDITVKITVAAPDGEILFNGVMKENLYYDGNQYGTFSAIYKISDGEGNTVSKRCSVTVIDRVSPEVGELVFPTEVKLGETITIENPTVKDNMENGTIITWLDVERDGFDHLFIYDGKYTFGRVGKHVFTFYAQDETGNYTCKSYVVNCVE